jgi:cytoskeleton-associated protein 5
VKEIVEVLDIIFPWSSLHFSESNTTCVLKIIGSTKCLQSIAGFIVERDSEIHKAAISTLAVSYKVLGDDIWRFVGKLSSAQKGILDTKFKWKAREMDKRREGRPGEG